MPLRWTPAEIEQFSLTFYLYLLSLCLSIPPLQINVTLTYGYFCAQLVIEIVLYLPLAATLSVYHSDEVGVSSDDGLRTLWRQFVSLSEEGSQHLWGVFYAFEDGSKRFGLSLPKQSIDEWLYGLTIYCLTHLLNYLTPNHSTLLRGIFCDPLMVVFDPFCNSF